MTEKKNLIYIFILTLVAVVATLLILKNVDKLYRQEDQKATVDVTAGFKDQIITGWQTYTSPKINVEFKYPEKLKVTENGEKIILNHNIPFENTGCNMMGDEKKYPTLDDFNVAIQVVSGNIAQAAKRISPYMPAENFTKDSLKVSPGFIDQYSVGKWNGFAIYEGAEGCGHTIYYFPITSDKTLVITKDMVQQLSGVLSSNIMEEVLKVPGVISREESDRIFKQILETLTITNKTNTTSQTDEVN